MTAEDSLSTCLGCTNYNPCGGFMGRVWHWDDGKKNKNEVEIKSPCETCGVLRTVNFEREDVNGRRKLRCDKCGFTIFQ